MNHHDNEIKDSGGLDHAGIRRRLDRLEADDLYDGHRRVVHDDRGPRAVPVPPLLDVDARPDDFRDFVERWASDPFPAARAFALSDQGFPTDLPKQDRVAAVYRAATRSKTERRVRERESLKPLIHRVTEESTNIIRGPSDRAESVEMEVLDRTTHPAGRRDMVKMLVHAEEARIRARADLTPAEDRVWVLHYYRDMDAGEIAARRGTEARTVSVQLTRVRTKMKSAYRQLIGEPAV